MAETVKELVKEATPTARKPLIAWANLSKKGRDPRKVYLGNEVLSFAEMKDRLEEIQRDNNFIFYMVKPDTDARTEEIVERIRREEKKAA